MSLSISVVQKELVSGLEKIAKNKTVANTYMFVGPEGCGKIHVAISFVKSILSSQSETSAEKIKASLNKVDSLTHPDLHFSYPVNTNDKIKKDPVSVDFINEWRELVLESGFMNLSDWYKKIRIGNKQGAISVKEAEKISKIMSLKSYEGGYKFMIIWMPEKMNNSASNKLLKLLEEPPEKTVFILLCENDGVLLETIKSRCQKIMIKPPAQKDLKAALKLAYSLDDSAASEIASQSKGNCRKALYIVENQELEGLSNEDFVSWVRLAFKVKTSKQTIGELISFSEDMAKKSREDQKLFLKNSLSVFRKGMLFNYAVERSDLDFGNGFRLEKFAPYIHENNIAEIYDEIHKAYGGVERNGNSKIIFLDTSIKLTRLLHIKPSAKNEK